MAEYIEREAALKDYQTICNGVECARCPIRDKGHCKFEAYIRSIPAADVRPVVRGKWEYNPGDNIPYCSECMMPQDSECNYCPNCGADMREES